MKKTILALALIAFAASSNAQIIYTINGQTSNAAAPADDGKRGIGFGPELGLNMADMAFKPAGGTTTSFKPGLAIGGIVDFSFAKNFYLQPGLFYLMNGAKYSNPSNSGTDNLNTIQLPINVEYKLSKPGKNRLFFGIGPYIADNISGMTKSGGKSYTAKIGSDKMDDIKALDYGAGINIGYELAMGFFARAHYQMGFANLDPSGISGSSTTTSAIGVTVGYLFGGKPKKAASTDKK